MTKSRVVVIAVTTILSVTALQAAVPVRVVPVPPTVGTNDFYVSNAKPLAPSPLIKLPIGAIKPEGWLRRQLELQAEGFSGHLTEISKFLNKDGNAWLAADGQGHSPWEEMPYWLKGFGDTGYVLGDKRIIDEAKVWIEGMLNSRNPDGWFGPATNKTGSRDTKNVPDLWPNMVALNALQTYYEYTGDPRVLELMQEYFKWELTVPDEKFLEPFWQQQRASDNLASVYWLYNRTGQEYLLQLAEKIHRNTANWAETVASWHNVNIAQCFRARLFTSSRPATPTSSRRRSETTTWPGAPTARSPAACSAATRTAAGATTARDRASRPAPPSSSCSPARCCWESPAT